MKVAVIAKGNIKVEKKLRNWFVGFGKELNTHIFFTQHKEHAVELAKEAACRGFTHVIAIGGDGSLNEVLNGIFSANTENIPVIGYLPFGSANDFARTAGITDDVNHLKQLILENKTKKTDIGIASFSGVTGKTESRYFINISDVGIGGYAVEKLNRSKKPFGASFAYFYTILSSLITYKKQYLKCVSKEFTHEGNCMAVIAANGKYFGNGLCISPDSGLQNGMLNVVILGNITVFDYIKNLGNLKKGKKLIHPEVSYHSTKEIEVFSEQSQLCSIDMDGEFVGFAPVKFSVSEKKVDFLSV